MGSCWTVIVVEFRYYSQLSTVESRFLESTVSRTSRYFEPILSSLGFPSLKLYKGYRMAFANICERASSGFIFASASSDQFSHASSQDYVNYPPSGISLY